VVDGGAERIPVSLDAAGPWRCVGEGVPGRGDSTSRATSFSCAGFKLGSVTVPKKVVVN
jgi:hypothetical protein